MAPSHYLNQCWNIVNWTLGNKLQWNLNRNLNIFIEENAFENVWKMAAILSRPQCVNCNGTVYTGQTADSVTMVTIWMLFGLLCFFLSLGLFWLMVLCNFFGQQPWDIRVWHKTIKIFSYVSAIFMKLYKQKLGRLLSLSSFLSVMMC